MNLTYEKIETMSINLCEEEIAAFYIVENILCKLQTQLSIREKEMISMETGEVINPTDIERARGILDGIANLVTWELKSK